MAAGRDLDRIAGIIKDYNLDIVAMQEVLSEGKILTGVMDSKNISGQAKAYECSLKYRLGKDWDICWRDPKTKAKNYPFLGKDARGEGYAFLWNTSRVELPVNEKGNKIFPRIWRNYHIYADEKLMRLIREPCYGRFVVEGRKARPVEIRLINTHIVYGKPKADNLAVDLDFGAITMRKNEFQVLAGKIYPRINEHYKEIKNRVPYTLILGDYNLNLEGSQVTNASIPEVVCFNERGEIAEQDKGYKIYTVQKELSTLKKEKAGLANNYDHFSYDDRVKGRVSKEAETIKVFNNDNEEELIKYRKEVSDHLPIVIEIDI